VESFNEVLKTLEYILISIGIGLAAFLARSFFQGSFLDGFKKIHIILIIIYSYV